MSQSNRNMLEMPCIGLEPTQLIDNRISKVTWEDAKTKSELDIAKLSLKTWLTAKEAANYLGTTVGGVRNKVYRGHLTSYKPRGRLMFKRSELDRLIEGSRRGGFNAVQEYSENGDRRFRVRIVRRSKMDPTIRVQKKVVGFKSKIEAEKAAKKLERDAEREVWEREQKGSYWQTLVEQWELAHSKSRRSGGEIGPSTVDDYVQAVRTYTTSWWNRPAKEITRADVLDVLEDVIKRGRSHSRKRVVKSAIHRVFTWAIDHKKISGLRESPAQGISIKVCDDSTKPQMLTHTEIKRLLLMAQTHDHEWYPVWAMALLTGMRSGELYALEWRDVDLDNKLLTCQRTLSKRSGGIGPTKGRYYRDIPINTNVERLLVDLRLKSNGCSFVLPRFKEWQRGEQARVLRLFCTGISITPVKFHTLRACWATMLLRNSVAPIIVMKIGGWKDIKTMERYIRMAGIEIMGALDSLDLISTKEALGKVINLFE